jgi:hypothetical protein
MRRLTDPRENSRIPCLKMRCRERPTVSACYSAMGYRMTVFQASCKNRARPLGYGSTR